MKANIDRRSFLKGSLVMGAAAAAFGATGCAPKAQDAVSDQQAEEGSASAIPAPESVVETLETEVLVLGAGAGGLACAVQAALNGSKVLLLEKAAVTGGNANVSEGQFAIGTSLAKENGYEVTITQVLNHEMEFAQYRVDGLLWRDFIENSKENWEWCVEQGVEYSGVVDTYGGLLPTFHWFKDGVGAKGYAPQMTARAEELGVEIRLSTPAYKLIQDESGVVTGVYAKNDKDEDIQVNAKAVVLATGGWGCNEELIKKMGFDTTDWMQCGTDFHDGDGYKMAMDIGAKDMLPWASQLALNYCPAMPRQTFLHPYNGIAGITSGMAPVMWVNEEARRFVDESVLKKNMMNQAIPGREQKAVYTIFDARIWREFTAGITDRDCDAELAEAVEKNTPASIWTADTIEGLAEAVGLDPATLAAEVAEYNGFCETGNGDPIFSKPADSMAPIAEAPFYIVRNRLNFVTNFGGIGSNRNREVIDPEGNAIPGLYAAGLDGDMRYRNVYPINMPGTTIAGFIYNGRVAANKAKEYIEAMGA